MEYCLNSQVGNEGGAVLFLECPNPGSTKKAAAIFSFPQTPDQSLSNQIGISSTETKMAA
jgi:hypothetical protein